jgi:hypothetical protein
MVSLTTPAVASCLPQDGSTWVYIAHYSSDGVQLASVSLHAEDCSHPGAPLPALQPALPASSGAAAAAAGPVKHVAVGTEPCLVQVNNASLVPTVLAYAGQHTSVPLLVYINSNVTLANVDDLAPYGIPVNRPLVLAGLASVNTSMDFGMVVEQLNASQSNTSSVTFQYMVLENLAPGGEATSRASGPFSVLIQNNVFAVYFDRWGVTQAGHRPISLSLPWYMAVQAGNTQLSPAWDHAGLCMRH